MTSQDSTIDTAGFMQGVYSWMCAGLGLTALVAYYVSTSAAAINLIFGNSLIFYGLLIAEFAVVVYLSARVSKIKSGTATLFFLAYAALNGVTLASIFLVFTAASIGTTFAVAAGMFGFMSLYGYLTKTDLTAVGNLAFMGLIGIIIASLVNMFFQNATADWVISYLGVIIFVGLIAYDTQKIKRYAAMGIGGEEGNRKGSIMGALSLYLDFINLFLMLLRIFGKRR